MKDCSSNSGRGFTLIELMITVAIVALLASLAYPAYTGSILKGKRAEGRAALTDLLQQQERYLTQTGSYMTFAAGATGANGTINPAVGSQTIPFKTFSGDSLGNRAYDLGAELCTASGASTPARNECVRVTATPRGGVATDPEVQTIRLWSTGLKDCTGTNAAKCWR